MGAAAKRQENPRNYNVGYGKPPFEHRFQKGQSGNPRGRTRKDTRTLPPPAGLQEGFLNVANQPVTMTVDGRQITTTRLEAAVHRLSAEALKGNMRAMKLFLDYGHKHMGQAEETASAILTHEQALEQLMNPPWMTEEEKEKEQADWNARNRKPDR